MQPPLGSPLVQRQSFFVPQQQASQLGVYEASSQIDSNVILFDVKNDGITANGINAVFETMNLGDTDAAITIDYSTSTAVNPSYEPFASELGTAFAGSFGNATSITVVPGGHLKTSIDFPITVLWVRITNTGKSTVKMDVSSSSTFEQI